MVRKVEGGYKITDKEYERMKLNAKIVRGIKSRKATKGSVKTTGKTAGDLRFETHRGEKDFHRGGHDQKEKRKPFTKKK